MSKDIPIIFSAPMVRALLEGRKTMTRRILKPQPEPFKHDDGRWCDVDLLHVQGDPRPRVTLGRVVTRQEIRYAAGDRLWVRENFAYVGTCDPGFLTFGATYPGDLAKYGCENVPPTLKEAGYKWKPSIHMPRHVSRLTLAVTAVKIERLYDIGDDDIRAEGIQHTETSWLNAWRQLWESINGPADWEANPFVVAVSFRVIKANIDAPEAKAAA